MGSCPLRTLLMEILFCVKEWETTAHIDVDALVARLQRHFPTAKVDRERGDAHVQKRLEDLIAMGAPEVVLDSQRSLFGHVVFIEISARHWSSATATSYLQTLEPPLGDRTCFEIDGAADQAALDAIAAELGVGLGMEVCSKWCLDSDAIA